MRIDKRSERAYLRHSKHQTFQDNKRREHFFVVENLGEDFLELKKILAEYSEVRFDFCASCLYFSPLFLRVFNDVFTGRFPIDEQVPLATLKELLIAEGYIFMPKGKKSGPLCLNDDFSEPFSAKRFRFLLPTYEVYLFLRYR